MDSIICTGKLSISTLSISTLSIMTLSITKLSITLKKAASRTKSFMLSVLI
jgi:hypothetical protein